MGPHEENLLGQAKRMGHPIPDRIKNKPKLGLGLEFFLDSFFELEHDRNWLTGNAIQPLPISWTTIKEYALINNVSGNLLDDLLYYVRELDAVYIKYLNRKQ